MIKKMKLVLGALILAAAPMLAFSPQASAAGQTCAWTGAGADKKFSTVGNWSNCGGGAPTGGDSIAFDNSTLAADKTVVNDLSSVYFISIVGTGTNTGRYSYGIEGSISLGGTIDGARLLGQVIITAATTAKGEIKSFASASTLVINGNLRLEKWNGIASSSISGSGNITAAGTGTYAIIGDMSSTTDTVVSAWTGDITAGEGAGLDLYKVPLTAQNTVTVNADSTGLNLQGYDGGSITSPLTIASTLSNSPVKGGGFTGQDPFYNATWAGPVTLASDIKVYGLGIVTITGPLSGNHTISMAEGQLGSLVITSSNNTSKTPNGTVASAVLTTEYKDNWPDNFIYVGANQIGILTGKYRSAEISGGGVRRLQRIRII